MNKNTKTGAKSLSIAYFALFVVVGDAIQVSAIPTTRYPLQTLSQNLRTLLHQ